MSAPIHIAVGILYMCMRVVHVKAQVLVCLMSVPAGGYGLGRGRMERFLMV